MAATFGTILAYIYKHIDENNKPEFKQIIELCTEEKLSNIIKAKTIDEKLIAIENLKEDIFAPELIPLAKLMLKSKPGSHENLLAYIVFSYEILYRMSNLEIQIEIWNGKIEEILKLSESIVLSPNELSERANWILNFKRFKEIYEDKFKRTVNFYENKEIDMFNKYWKTIINHKNEEIKLYKSLYFNEKHIKNNILKQLEYNDIIKTQYKELQKFLYGNSNINMHKFKYGKMRQKYGNTNDEIRKQIYILKRITKKNMKILNIINNIWENSNEIYEELMEEQKYKRMEILENAIKATNNNDIYNKINIHNRDYKYELEQHEKLWKNMNLNNTERFANIINLKLNYIINKIENKGGTGKLSKIDEGIENISTDDETKDIKYMN